LSTQNYLAEISSNHQGKYSDKWSSYLEIYWDLFEPIRSNEADLLEIGIQNGGSLEIWAKLFPNAENLIGFDVHPKCKDLKFSDPRIKVFVEDASDPKSGALVKQVSSNLGVVIDDGSHVSKDIIRSFLIFFPQLKPGGLYVIEDLHASYWSEWQGGVSHPESSMQFLKLLADVVNFDHWGIRANRTELFEFIRATSDLLDESTFSKIESVTFLDSVCVVRKKTITNQGLGVRIGSGSEAIVFEGVKESAGAPNTPPNQESNEFAIAKDLSLSQAQNYKTQNQELQTQNQQLQTQNQELQTQNQQLQTQNQQLQTQNQQLQTQNRYLHQSISEIQATLSWRITKPLRQIRAQLSRFWHHRL
jgi:hypothetical protein